MSNELRQPHKNAVEIGADDVRNGHGVLIGSMCSNTVREQSQCQQEADYTAGVRESND